MYIFGEYIWNYYGLVQGWIAQNFELVILICHIAVATTIGEMPSDFKGLICASRLDCQPGKVVNWGSYNHRGARNLKVACMAISLWQFH